MLEAARDVVVAVSRASGSAVPNTRRDLLGEPGEWSAANAPAYISGPIGERHISADAPTVVAWLKRHHTP